MNFFLKTLFFFFLSPPERQTDGQLAVKAFFEDREERRAISWRSSTSFLYIMVSTMVWVGAFIRKPLFPLGSSGTVASLGPRWSAGRELAPPRTGAATALILCKTDVWDEDETTELTYFRQTGCTEVLKVRCTHISIAWSQLDSLLHEMCFIDALTFFSLNSLTPTVVLLPQTGSAKNAPKYSSSSSTPGDLLPVYT